MAGEHQRLKWIQPGSVQQSIVAGGWDSFQTGDTGELNFESFPVGQVERVEVVKGAGSALYGSSALGGVINVITKRIPDQPETRIRTYGGFYGAPSFSSWDWGGGTRFLDGQSFSHSRTFDNVGLLVFGSRASDDGFRQNDYRRRYNGYLKAHINLSSYDALTTTFSLLHQKRGSFLYWDDLSHALVPPPQQQGDVVRSTRFFWNGLYTHTVSSAFVYAAKAMWYRNKWEDTIDSGSPSNVAVHHYAGEADRPDSPQDPGRDAVTLPLIRAALERQVPVFCICRGFQELNVALGGMLHTQIHTAEGHLDHRAPENAPYDDLYQPAHKAAFMPGGIFARVLGKTEALVNSVHWQGIARPADRLVIEGRAEDGVIEAVTIKDHAGFCIGTQWHPEYRAVDNPDSMALFRAFGDACRARRAQRLGRAPGGHKSGGKAA